MKKYMFSIGIAFALFCGCFMTIAGIESKSVDTINDENYWLIQTVAEKQYGEYESIEPFWIDDDGIVTVYRIVVNDNLHSVMPVKWAYDNFAGIA